MRYFDPHIHMLSRTTDDYENMAEAGIIGVVEPAFWQGQPRTQVGSFIDYYNSLIGWEPFRASQFGIRHYCTMGTPVQSDTISLCRLPRLFCGERWRCRHPLRRTYCEAHPTRCSLFLKSGRLVCYC